MLFWKYKFVKFLKSLFYLLTFDFQLKLVRNIKKKNEKKIRANESPIFIQKQFIFKFSKYTCPRAIVCILNQMIFKKYLNVIR